MDDTDDLSSLQRKDLKFQELRLKQKKLEILEGLPHLYGFKFYHWAREFFESRNKMILLTAANQISKSSTQIRKQIHWATAMDLWPKLWKRRPRQFWYLYPSKDVATIEYHTKWVPEFLPRGVFKDHPQYGWKPEIETKQIVALHFHVGVSIYFKTYKQDLQTLQTGTVDYVGADEELPEVILPELQARLFASDGYFSSVFTPTINQDLWRRAMECIGTKDEVFPDAKKFQISMYDCMHYEDGSPSLWTPERIREVERQCRSKTEIQRRVFGRFVQESGRRYPTFDPERHYIPPFAITNDFHIYTGVDPAGGGEGHPAAITFVAVTPDYKKGYIIRTWRGDGVETSSSDIIQKYIEMKGNLAPVVESYDWQAKDFEIIARRMGLSFVPAQKARDRGEEVMNTLFKNDMLFIFDTEDNRKLGSELMSLMVKTPKPTAKDDLTDSTRYAVMPIPFDWTAIPIQGIEHQEKVIESRPLTEKEYQEWEMKRRRGESDGRNRDAWSEIEDEIEYWNEHF